MSTRHPDPSIDDGPITLAAASFLAQVLGLETSPNALAELRGDLSTIKRDHNAAIYTIQLDSSVGMAAFLVYAYQLDAHGGDGKSGRALYEAGVRTLEEAAERNTPGPRAVANAETDDYGFILATTPGTYRALTAASQRTAPASAPHPPAVTDQEPAAEASPPRRPAPVAETPAPTRPRLAQPGSPTPAPSLPTNVPLEPAPAPRRTSRAPAPLSPADNDAIRSEAADRLLMLIKDANAEARTWLNALVTASNMASDAESDDELIAFNIAETALALHVLDDENVSALLRALNLLVAGAAQQARAGQKTEPDD